MKSQRLLIWLAAAIVAGSFIFVGAGYAAQTETVHQQVALIETLSGDSAALRAQVYSTGETPVAPPAEARVDGVDGARGIAGSQGVAGLDGRDGVDGTNGIDGISPAAIPGSNGTIGETGTSGVNGADGLSGASGADGAPGQNGADGAAGADGADGEPPASWTFTDTQGVTYTCTRAEPFDAANPQYTCTTPTQGVTP